MDTQSGAALVRVYFATDRELTGSEDPTAVFGGQRSRDLTLGVAQVRIPPGHSCGNVERPDFPWQSEDPNRHVLISTVERFGPSRDTAAEQAFITQVREAISASEVKQTLIFVHGYAVSFELALREAAQMAHDIRFDGVPILYSWSSSGDVFGYLIDGTNAEWTGPYFARFLELVSDESAARRIHMIGHSMGVRVIVRGIRDFIASRYAIPLSIVADPEKALADVQPPEREFPFDQVVLAAADIDAAIFERDYVPFLLRGARRTTIYVSARDRALGLSGRLNGYERLGQTDLPNVDLDALRRIEVVDVTAFDYDWWNHAYHAHLVEVLADLAGVFAGEEPAARGLRREFVYRMLPQRNARP